MADESFHPLLAQLPLTVSPYVEMPSAVTLPYTYRQLPPGLPPPSTAPIPPNVNPPPPQSEWGYITSASGETTTTPDRVLAMCQQLTQHIKAEREKAERLIKEWEEEIRQRDLAEKRRVAPGYLDTGLHMLEPVKVGPRREQPKELANDEESELDKAFGRMAV